MLAGTPGGAHLATLECPQPPAGSVPRSPSKPHRSAEGRRWIHRVSVPPKAPDVVTPEADSEVAAEQDYLTLLYQHLDERRRYTARRLAEVLSAPTTGTPQALSERDAAAAMYSEQLATLDGVEQGLCFGRLDLHSDEEDENGRRYIGRLGLLDEERDYQPLLIDWRAPAARPFYTATAARPEGVRRRRHIRTRSRTVLAVDDEVLDLDGAPWDGGAGQDPARTSLTSEAALMATLGQTRTGQMSDIVATIQAEQDRIIRAKPQGVLVVQGGPGTGKTAVALHRAAYLLYTHRRQLARRGVLVVGPNSTFLRYIGHVLPSLGETSVLLCTVAQLHPGLHACGVESDETAAIKGRLEMAKVVAAAVRDRQHVPTEPLELTVESQPIRLDRAVCLPARTRARQSRRPHNEAKRIFHHEVMTALADQVASGFGDLGRDVLSGDDLADIRAELRASPELTAALETLWPTLSPEQLLTDLYADPQRLTSATQRALDPQERDLLARPAPGLDVDPDQVWTPADVPLLDEAAELLGSDGSAQAAREAAALRAELRYAQGVLDILDLDEDLDPELLRATDLIDADRLADRQRQRRDGSIAERAAADRTWTYGHIIIDEAQELSPMAWRVLMRRCPSRSMTVVGDLAQTGNRAGASSWQDVLGPYVARRWRLEQLTINYRNPAEIAELADEVLAAIDVGLTPPQAVRRTGVPPRAVQVSGLPGELPEKLAAELPAVVADEATAVGDGRVAILGPAGMVDELRKIVPAASSPELDAPVTVLTVTQAKGLEFDAVVLVDPATIVAESPRGLNDLYVALTRTTHRLCLVHPGELPEVLAALQP
ncbi:MAG: AAA family ATPase [Pseudonocardiales bacterium]|nr:AAA family ATPase [Pseudonocardiales bacterium]